MYMNVTIITMVKEPALLHNRGVCCRQPPLGRCFVWDGQGSGDYAARSGSDWGMPRWVIRLRAAQRMATSVFCRAS